MFRPVTRQGFSELPLPNRAHADRLINAKTVLTCDSGETRTTASRACSLWAGEAPL